MTLRLSEADDAMLSELARLSGLSKHEAALRSIRQAHDSTVHEIAVAESSAKMRDRYAHLLERLGN